MRSVRLLLDLANALEADLNMDRQPEIALFRLGLIQRGPLDNLDETYLLSLARLWPLAMRAGPEFLRALIEAKPPLDKAPPGYGYLTPVGHALDHAMRSGSSEACSMLLQAGASPDSPRFAGGEPCLAQALSSPSPGFSLPFIHAGADLSWSHPVTGASYLHYAVGHNHPDAVSALLLRGANPQAGAANGLVPTDMAIALEHDECAQIIDSFLEAQELSRGLESALSSKPLSL